MSGAVVGACLDGRARTPLRADVRCWTCAAGKGLPALPEGAIGRPIDPSPILGASAQPFPYRIHQDVTRLFLQLLIVAQAMVKKIALPFHAKPAGDVFLPV